MSFAFVRRYVKPHTIKLLELGCAVDKCWPIKCDESIADKEKREEELSTKYNEAIKIIPQCPMIIKIACGYAPSIVVKPSVCQISLNLLAEIFFANIMGGEAETERGSKKHKAAHICNAVAASTFEWTTMNYIHATIRLREFCYLGIVFLSASSDGIWANSVVRMSQPSINAFMSNFAFFTGVSRMNKKYTESEMPGSQSPKNSK